MKSRRCSHAFFGPKHADFVRNFPPAIVDFSGRELSPDELLLRGVDYSRFLVLRSNSRLIWPFGLQAKSWHFEVLTFRRVRPKTDKQLKIEDWSTTSEF
jgi:hypothetical protein